VRRIVGAGDLWVTEFTLAYDGRPSYSLSIMEFLDGKVARETQYFADPSSREPRVCIGSSVWGEINGTVARPRILDRAELPVDTALLARFLVGKMLVRTLAEGVAGGRIVETEAYGVGDPAGHAYRGMTPRNRALFLERGHAYVYLAYGASFMLKRLERDIRRGRGCLDQGDRANLWHRDHGAKSRRRSGARFDAGPGRLSAALEINRQLDGIDLCRTGPLWLGSDGQASDEIGQSERIGITRAVDRLLRFYVRGSRFVSGPQALNR